MKKHKSKITNKYLYSMLETKDDKYINFATCLLKL